MEASALPRTRTGLLPRSRRLLAALGDDRLVEQVRRGNVAAFEVLFDRHYRGILAFCRHMLGSLEEAEDAVQQTFASAYTDLQSNDRDIRLKAWLYTIARNRCLSILRARREQPAELDDVPTAGLSEQVQQRADLQELLEDLRELPTEQREALVLFEIGDLSQAEVANVIGVEPVKVKALVFQARSALIENREARAIACSDIREQLATATGGALRRGPLRRHLKTCDGCSEYREQVRNQRRALALALPVVPSAGFKESVLSAIGFGGGAGGGGIAAGGGVAASSASSTGLFASIGGAGIAKLAVGGTLGIGALAAGGVAVHRTVDDSGTGVESAQAAEDEGADRGAGGGPTGSPALISSGATEQTRDRKSDYKTSDDEKSDDDRGRSGDDHGRKRDRDGRRSGRRGDGRKGSRGNSQSNTGRRFGVRVGGSRPAQPGSGGTGRQSGSTGSINSDGRSTAGPDNAVVDNPASDGTAGSKGGRRTHAPAQTVPPPVATDGDEVPKIVLPVDVPLP